MRKSRQTCLTATTNPPTIRSGGFFKLRLKLDGYVSVSGIPCRSEGRLGIGSRIVRSSAASGNGACRRCGVSSSATRIPSAAACAVPLGRRGRQTVSIGVRGRTGGIGVIPRPSAASEPRVSGVVSAGSGRHVRTSSVRRIVGLSGNSSCSVAV